MVRCVHQKQKFDAFWVSKRRNEGKKIDGGMEVEHTVTPLCGELFLVVDPSPDGYDIKFGLTVLGDIVPPVQMVLSLMQKIARRSMHAGGDESEVVGFVGWSSRTSRVGGRSEDPTSQRLNQTKQDTEDNVEFSFRVRETWSNISQKRRQHLGSYRSKAIYVHIGRV